MIENPISPLKITWFQWVSIIGHLTSSLFAWWHETSKDGVIDANEIKQLDDIVLAAFQESVGQSLRIQLNQVSAQEVQND